MTRARLEPVLAELRNGLVPLVGEARELSMAPSPLAGKQCNPYLFVASWPNDAYHEAAGQHATNGVYENQTALLNINHAITVESRQGDPVPLIPTTASPSPSVLVSAGATLRRLRIETNIANVRGLDITGSNATIERVFVRSPRTACRIVGDQVLIRDYVCWTSFSVMCRVQAPMPTLAKK